MDSLPADVWRKIIKYLGARELGALARTSRILERVVVDRGHIGDADFGKAARHAIRCGHVRYLERLLSSHAALFLKQEMCLRLIEAAIVARSEPAAQLLLRLLKSSPKYRSVNLFATAAEGRVHVSLSHSDRARRVGFPLLMTSFFRDLHKCRFCGDVFFDQTRRKVTRSACDTLVPHMCAYVRLQQGGACGFCAGPRPSE